MDDKLFTEEQLETALQTLNVAWSAIPSQGLVRVFETGSFAEGVALIGKLAQIAEKRDHHPAIRLTVDEVEVTLITHDAGGITNRDVAMAQEIDSSS